ncbi:MAG: hypothetical protein WCT08_00600 [Patescibacteria group bacterium]|jgi:hypothetical protein
MFHITPPKPTKAKHIIYLISTTILGILLSLLAHVGLESWYLHWAQDNNHLVVWYGGCALPWEVQVALPILGALFGFWLGRIWWRIVYVEQKWLKKK